MGRQSGRQREVQDPPELTSVGKFEVPNWDKESQDKVRNALNALAPLRGDDTGAMFGNRSEVDPVAHLIGTAIGWGGNPRYAAVYDPAYPKDNDGRTAFRSWRAGTTL
jgi:hypothetical protein